MQLWPVELFWLSADLEKKWAKSVQLVRVASFRGDFLQNLYFSYILQTKYIYLISITEFWGNDESPFFTNAHAQDTFFPSLDNLSYTNLEFEWFISVNWWIEFGSILKCTFRKVFLLLIFYTTSDFERLPFLKLGPKLAFCSEICRNQLENEICTETKVFERHFLPFNILMDKINAHFVIDAILASFWNMYVCSYSNNITLHNLEQLWNSNISLKFTSNHKVVILITLSKPFQDLTTFWFAELFNNIFNIIFR